MAIIKNWTSWEAPETFLSSMTHFLIALSWASVFGSIFAILWSSHTTELWWVYLAMHEQDTDEFSWPYNYAIQSEDVGHLELNFPFLTKWSASAIDK